MANGSPFAVNFLLLVFLLVPGYASLRGYLGATVQLDTVTRFDKLLLSVVGGTLTLGVSLAGYRLGVVDRLWRATGSLGRIDSLGTKPLSTTVVSETSASAVVVAVLGLSCLGYALGYGCGTLVHGRNTRKKSQEDLEQPWETAVKQSALGDEVIVVTRDGERIHGQLYRIGSPSEDYDLLLSRAEREGEDGRIPLGMTYHHYRDILRIQFPQMQERGVGNEANVVFRLGGWAAGLPSRAKSRATRIKQGTEERLCSDEAGDETGDDEPPQGDQ